MAEVHRPDLDVIMISNFGASDGGRETWAYNFLPRLMAELPNITIRVFGFRISGQENNAGSLREATRRSDRFSCVFLEGRRGWLPVSIHMIRGLRKQFDGPAQAAPVSLAVGGLMEFLAVLASGRLRRSYKIFWLRTIWMDEKASQLPRLLRPIFRRFEDIVLSRADQLIANGADTAAHYRARGLEIVTIANGVDAERWRHSVPDLNGVIRVAFIGRPIPGKSIAEFLHVASELHGSGEFEFHVIGGPPTAAVMEAAELGHVVYAGAIPNRYLPALVKSVDVCVALTRSLEATGGGGLSNALLEQMAAARVILAWDTVNSRMILTPDNAYIVPMGDTTGLIQALRDIRSNPAEARRRASAAATSVAPFTYDSHIAKFINLLREAPGLQLDLSAPRNDREAGGNP